MKYAAIRLTLLALAVAPLWLAYAQLQQGSTIRAVILATLSATLAYLLVAKKWPKILDEDGEGIAGVWGLRAVCRKYSRPPPAYFSGRHLTAVGNEGYETKVCIYAYYLLKPPRIEEELPPGGEPCSPEFHVYPRPQPPVIFAERSEEVALIAWHERGVGAYPHGNATIRMPKTLKPPRQDNTWAEYRLYTDWIRQAKHLAYALLDRAKPSPTGEVRLGVDEHGGEYRLPLDHTGVFGSTGCGKSSTLALLAQRLAERGYRVWIVDPYGEYRLEGFETLYSVPDPLEKKMPTEALQLLEDASILAFGVQRGSYSPIVYQVVKQALSGSRNIEEVVSKLRRQIAQADRWDVEQAIAAALRRLEPLAEVKWLGKEIPGRVVFDISALTGMAKILAVNSVLEKAWEKGRTVVVVDEAGNLARTTGPGEYVALPALKKVIMLGRSRNVYVILADQYADRLPFSLLGQLTKIWMRHKPPLPLAAPQVVRGRLERLRTGEAIIDGTLVKIDPPPRLGTKLSSILEKITLEELKSFIEGNASPEVKRKVWRLGLARGSKLTERGRRVYRMLKEMRKTEEEAKE